jgi:thioredoxin-related protein
MGESTGSLGVQTGRVSLLVPLIGAALLALPGCGKRSDLADNASTAQTTPSIQAVPQAPPPPRQAPPAAPFPLAEALPVKPGWLTNYDQGQQEAKANNKLVLLDFTGSDWCGWCKLLDREIFSKSQFKEYATKNLVLVELDFPRMKSVPPATKAQNERLFAQYQIQGLPTIIVLNGDGKVVAELGYMEGGPDAFIAVLEKLRKG